MDYLGVIFQNRESEQPAWLWAEPKGLARGAQGRDTMYVKIGNMSATKVADLNSAVRQAQAGLRAVTASVLPFPSIWPWMSWRNLKKGVR